MAAKTGRQAAQAHARLNEALAKHLVTDFIKYGGEVIARLRKDNPAEYLRMVTTAFAGGVSPAVPPVKNNQDAASPRPRSSPPSRGQKLWLIEPEIEEIVEMTSRRAVNSCN